GVSSQVEIMEIRLDRKCTDDPDPQTDIPLGKLSADEHGDFQLSLLALGHGTFKICATPIEQSNRYGAELRGISTETTVTLKAPDVDIESLSSNLDSEGRIPPTGLSVFGKVTSSADPSGLYVHLDYDVAQPTPAGGEARHT